MQVAQIAVRAALQSSGQNCAGAERFYVHRDIYASFVSQVAKIVKSVSAVSMSPLKTFFYGRCYCCLLHCLHGSFVESACKSLPAVCPTIFI